MKPNALRNNWPKKFLGKGILVNIEGFRASRSSKGLQDTESLTGGVKNFFSCFEANRTATLAEYMICLYETDSLLETFFDLAFMKNRTTWARKMVRGLDHLVKYLRSPHDTISNNDMLEEGTPSGNSGWKFQRKSFPRQRYRR